MNLGHKHGSSGGKQPPGVKLTVLGEFLNDEPRRGDVSVEIFKINKSDL